ncbi:transposable element Tcb1 transposase [Trichonephila clavipes]|nr:transposable element Tcb1 transposase [Trichonephila clavipes]
MSFTALGLQYVMPEIISGTSLVLQNITLEFYTGVLNSSCAEDLLGTYDDTASGQKHPGTPPIVDNHASLTEQHIMSHIPPIPAKRGYDYRRGRSHPPQCTTSYENREIVHMAVTDRSVTSQTIAQHIESVTHHSASTRTIRRCLQQSGLSARRPLLGLPLTRVTHPSVTPRWSDSSLETPWRVDAELRYAPLHWSCTGIMVWGGIVYHSCTPLIHIAGTHYRLEPVVFPYLQGLATAIF